jgi:hypothetical protein
MRDYNVNPLSDAERAALRGIRVLMGSFGSDVGELTDEELNDGILRFHDIAREASLSIDEATAAFTAFGRSL